MHYYSAYEHRIASEVPLPSLEQVKEAPLVEQDVVVREVDRETISLRSDEEARSPGGDCVVSHYEDRLHYAVRGGRDVEIYRDSDVEDDFVGRCVISLPLAIALRQRGFTALHGACVAMGDRAVAIMGPSGAGKSTLTEAFYQRGYDVLCDDLLVIRFDKGVPYALPGPASTRLREGAGRALVEGYESLPRAWSGSPQRYRRIDRSPRHPTKLVRIYLIDGRDRERNEVVPFGARDTVLSLASQTWAYKRFGGHPYATDHMDRLASLASSGITYRLDRKLGLDVLGDTVEFIAADAALRDREEE